LTTECINRIFLAVAVLTSVGFGVTPATGQTASAVDSLETAALAQAASLIGLEPNAEAIVIAPAVDLWETGVSPTKAVLMTPLFPGWGQLYADNYWRGALGFGIEMFYWTNMLSRDRRARQASDFAKTFPEGDPNRERYDSIAEENWEQVKDFAWWSGGVLLIIALDAYVGAHLFNFENDPVPVPNRWDDHFGPPGGDMPGGVPPQTLTVFQWRKTF